MNIHRQNIESAWEELLAAICGARDDARQEQISELAIRLDTLYQAFNGISRAWGDIRELFPYEKDEEVDQEIVAGTLPQSAFWHPLAQALLRLGGSAQAGTAIAEVEKIMDGELKAADRELVATGSVRWMTNVRFARQKLKEHGLIMANSPHGTWELTDAGSRWATGESSRLPAPMAQPDPNQQLFSF